MSEQSIYFPSEQAVFRTVGDEAVILDMSAGLYFGLDPVGTRIWQFLLEGKSVEQIASGLEAEFDVEQAQVTEDVRALLEELLEAGLVKQQEQLTTNEA